MTRILLFLVLIGTSVLYGVSPSTSENFMTLYVKAPDNHEVTIRHGGSIVGKRVNPDRWELNIPFKEKAAVTAEIRYVGVVQDGPAWVSPKEVVQLELFEENGLPRFSKDRVDWGEREYRDARKWVLDVKIGRNVQPLTFDVLVTKQLVSLQQVTFYE